MTVFEDILKAYSRKIHETWGNNTETTTEMIDRLNDSYWVLLRKTGASWQPPATLTLAAVTASTNKHKLITALNVSSCEVLSVDEVRWEGVPLAQWTKQQIDAVYDDGYSTTAGDPIAYALWVEGDDTYIAFYPFIATANTADCKITWCKRPAKVTESTYETGTPLFADQFCDVLAEEMAIQFLMELSDSKLSNTRLILHENNVKKMTNFYIDMRTNFLDYEQARKLVRFYGE